MEDTSRKRQVCSPLLFDTVESRIQDMLEACRKDHEMQASVRVMMTELLQGLKQRVRKLLLRTTALEEGIALAVILESLNIQQFKLDLRAQLSRLRTLTQESRVRELQYTYRLLRRECCTILAKTYQLLSGAQVCQRSLQTRTVLSAKKREGFVYKLPEVPHRHAGDSTSSGNKFAAQTPIWRSPPLHGKQRREQGSPGTSKSVEYQKNASPDSARTTHLVQRFRDSRPGAIGDKSQVAAWSGESPRTPGSIGSTADWQSVHVSLKSGQSHSVTSTRSNLDLISANSSVFLSGDSSLPLSSLPASLHQSRPSSSSLSVLSDSTVPSITNVSTQSAEYSMASSLPGSASPPIV
ncbi:hypothetical protein NliqN6_5759 [Naganishia liquefaciens]|uniref:Uncharacterized protein n=1 Tax=Naganishia liquefaciens TaxID=104408 RepID=A0A8H3TYC8_9TREE|nr:hypothetical protein NliqN6_5759 [Naganishia liquefaciens]